MITINDAADYIILKLTAGGESLNNLKLQKLLYYVQAWHLAIYGGPAFGGRFQAWIHGPVSRTIYNRFASSKSLYSEINATDMSVGFDLAAMDPGVRRHIDSVLEAYVPFSGAELEDMTHNEDPWISARQGFGPSERCEVEIDENLMASYYRKRLR